MFNSITWEDFLMTTFIAVIAYYIIASLALYAHEIMALLKGKASWHSTAAEQGRSTHTYVMGEAQKDNTTPRTSSMNSEDIRFAHMPSEDVPDVITTAAEKNLSNNQPERNQHN